MNCPTHNVPLSSTQTRFGIRYYCPEAKCSVACWDGSTSTPADDETRALRRQCHELFDPLWNGPKWRRPFKKRGDAYVWMRQQMRLTPEQAHIGMMSAEQCRELIRHLEGFR